MDRGRKDAKSEVVALFIQLVLQNAAKTLETMVLRLGGYLNATEFPKLFLMVPKVSSNKNVIV